MVSWIVAGWLVATAVAGDVETVTLAAPGIGERAVRRVEPPVGTRQALTLTRDLTLSITAMGQEQRIVEPRVEADLDLAVKGAHEGVATVGWTYMATRGGGGSMSPAYAGLKGATDDFTLTVDGDLEGTFSKGFDLDLWTVRLPAEPVAVGASWTVTSTGRTGEGITLTERQTITLVGIDAGRLALKVILEQEGTPADTVVQGMPARVERHRATGVGDLLVDPSKPLAVSGSWTIDLDVGLAMGGGAIRSGQKSHLELTLGTRG